MYTCNDKQNMVWKRSMREQGLNDVYVKLSASIFHYFTWKHFYQFTIKVFPCCRAAYYQICRRFSVAIARDPRTRQTRPFTGFSLRNNPFFCPSSSILKSRQRYIWLFLLSYINIFPFELKRSQQLFLTSSLWAWRPELIKESSWQLYSH